MVKMENVSVLMTLPMSSYMEEELEKRFTVFKPREYYPQGLIDSLPQLEIVVTYSVGFDKIDLNKRRERGIRVSNTLGVLTDDVANKWLVGIVGLGRIGTAIARRAATFELHHQLSFQGEEAKHRLQYYTYYSNILDLAGSCQILLVSCSLTEETRCIITRDVIDALGPKGILIKIAQGAHIDELELVSALCEGRLAGAAGLDVFENEPSLPESLSGLENVVLVPYVGSDTVETYKTRADLVVANLELHFLNKPV